MCCVVETDTLRKIIARCEAGDAMVQELCEFGDKLLSEETAKVFKKEKDMKKGIMQHANEEYCGSYKGVQVIVSLLQLNQLFCPVV